MPGGILLWGPPGTGKTLMAEAVAGETGRPYVFVDPGAFQNMFFGVGILKVKSLFRKLRKLALRYGGVIVFFDEADSLGSRSTSTGLPQPGKSRMSFEAPFYCNGLHYVSHDTAQRVTADLHAATPAPEPPSGIRGVVATGMMGGGGMGTLQALLSELSGLKKPRGFVSRRLRQFLTMPPCKPPKYRLLVMMATNLPEALDAALLQAGAHRPHLQGRLPHTRGTQAHVRGLPRQGQAPDHERAGRTHLAHVTARQRRGRQGHGQRGVDHCDAQRQRRRCVAGPARSQATEDTRHGRRRPSDGARTAFRRAARSQPRGGDVPAQAARDDRYRHDRATRAYRRVRLSCPARRARVPVALPPRGRGHDVPRLARGGALLLRGRQLCWCRR